MSFSICTRDIPQTPALNKKTHPTSDRLKKYTLYVLDLNRERQQPQKSFTFTGTLLFWEAPLPRRPKLEPFPQHQATSDLSIAHTTSAFILKDFTESLRADTSTGVSLFSVFPLPSWPEALAPQHFSVPLSKSAQEVSLLAAMETTPASSPATSTGELESAVVPFPNCPIEFHPQHLTPPCEESAHECLLPTTVCTTPRCKPATGMGEFLLVLISFPIPSCPLSLLPQHCARKSVDIAQW